MRLLTPRPDNRKTVCRLLVLAVLAGLLLGPAPGSVQAQQQLNLNDPVQLYAAFEDFIDSLHPGRNYSEAELNMLLQDFLIDVYLIQQNIPLSEVFAILQTQEQLDAQLYPDNRDHDR